MVLKGLANTLNSDMKKMETIITGRKFTQGVCAAAVIGFIAGILITHRPRKKMRDDVKNKTSNASVTIEVRDLERLTIERLE